MFAPFCTRHGSRVLLPLTAISAIAHEDEGLVIAFSCSCGAAGSWRPAPRA